MFHDHHDTLAGPHFDAALFAPNGSLARFHKGGGKSAPKPPKPNKKLEQMQMKLMKAQLRQAGQKIEMPKLARVGWSEARGSWG
jgi:hypothetical protein